MLHKEIARIKKIELKRIIVPNLQKYQNVHCSNSLSLKYLGDGKII